MPTTVHPTHFNSILQINRHEVHPPSSTATDSLDLRNRDMASTHAVPDSWDRIDHIYGTLYGNGIGDAIGLLTEFMSKKQAKETYGEYKHLEYEHKIEDLHRMRWKIRDWTDDTDQMILIMDSLSDNRGKIDVIDIAEKLYKWTTRGYRELGDYVGMGIGTLTNQVIKHKDFKTNPHKVADNIWTSGGCVVASNGGVMRTSILGIHQYDDIDAVTSNATAICKTTHADPRCVASCVAVCCAIAYMLQRKHKHVLSNGDYNIEAIMKDSYATAKPCLVGKHYKKYKKELKKYLFAKHLSSLHLDAEDSIGYTYKAMGAGFWALQQTDFRTALENIVFEGGDADTNGAVAGALLGCKLGNKQLPPSWRDTLLHKDWLDVKITRFLDLQNEIKQKTESSTAPANEEEL